MPSEIIIKYGDNIEVLRGYPDNYFDSVVTDSPYGFGAEPKALDMLRAWIDNGYLEVKGSGFMGKKWDSFVPQPMFWKEVFRVLKPGGYLLSFFGTRTYDWGTMAIRLAGFEIRDMICWIYGSGFPKSLNISKALDKEAGAERKVVSEGKAVKRMIPGADQDKTGSWIKDNGREYVPQITEAAKQWDGYGTAVKPASEPICVARKPIQKGLTVAENVLKYGTGGINIDGCRIDFVSQDDLASATYGTGTNIMGGNYVGSKLISGRKNIEANALGRFPANIILDPFMGSVMDEQTGVLTSGKPSGLRSAGNNIYGQYAPGQEVTGFGDSGGASRFFYCAKSSQEERNAGCESLVPAKGGVANEKGRSFNGVCITSGLRLQVCECGDCKHDPSAQIQVANSHPTIKPISLMRWLIRLVTPKGGRTLDPFAGSGTSGCAAAFEDVDIVLIENEAEYIPIIECRTKYWQNKANREKYIQELKDSQLTMF
jgi:site-specific DNA-methyltransferase (adenine-specific)